MFTSKDHNRPSTPVVTALRGFPKGLCDNCLSQVVAKSRADAITPARRLLGPNAVKRTGGTCDRCQKIRTLTRLVSKPKIVTENNPDSHLVKLRDLDAAWQQVISYLDSLDGTRAKEDFASRIEALRKERKIAPTFATLLVTCLTYRHEIRFHSFEASPVENEMLQILLFLIRVQLGQAPLAREDDLLLLLPGGAEQE